MRRKLLNLFLVPAAASISLLTAAPSLTTIQDILYKADGTRFNGAINIQWNNFQAADASIVATQSLTVQIVNGVLKVQLVPTTNASAGANYQVMYSSAGQFQFTETWAVPPSTVTLQVKDVRVSTGSTVGGGTTTVITGSQVQISDVQGLSNELLTRPIEGTAYSPGRAAIINSAGQIDAATGNLSNCILVDGTSAPCGGVGSNNIAYSDAETPNGNVDGVNNTFTLAFAPAPPASLILYVNGLYMTPTVDYTLTGGSIVFMTPSLPQPGDIVTASYRYPPTGQVLNLETGTNAPEVLCNGSGTTTAATTLQILASCHIAANKLVSGDRVEIKFGLTHQGTTTGFNPAIYWGSTGLVLRAMNASDTALVGEANIIVANDGTFTHFTTSTGSAGLPLITSGAVTGGIQNANTVSFDGSLAPGGNQDSVSLKFFIVTRYPLPL
jgi:hypothetical protein